MEVIDKQGKPIPGLYAGGVDTGGWDAETYNSLVMGSSISFAFSSGRIAGETLKHMIRMGEELDAIQYFAHSIADAINRSLGSGLHP